MLSGDFTPCTVAVVELHVAVELSRPLTVEIQGCSRAFEVTVEFFDSQPSFCLIVKLLFAVEPWVTTVELLFDSRVLMMQSNFCLQSRFCDSSRVLQLQSHFALR